MSDEANPVSAPKEGAPPAMKPAEAKPVAVPKEIAPPATKPPEAKPLFPLKEIAPPATKSAEAKPAETKPPEAKPADTKLADAQPVEAKPSETKPAETKPTATAPRPVGRLAAQVAFCLGLLSVVAGILVRYVFPGHLATGPRTFCAAAALCFLISIAILLAEIERKIGER